VSREEVLLARVERDTDGSLRVLSPGVGLWSDLPHGGALLGPGSQIGRLRRLTRRARLVLPEGAAGRLAHTPARDREVAVEYGQCLFMLTPVGAGAAEIPDEDAAALGRPAGADLPAGARAVVSPTDGAYYARPSPDAPPFVRPGARVREGQPVGLVEVMKTFNQILYGGPGFPAEAEVLEVRAADGEEVRAGQVLVVVR